MHFKVYGSKTRLLNLDTDILTEKKDLEKVVRNKVDTDQGFCDRGQRPAQEFCEHGSENSDCIKRLEFCAHLKDNFRCMTHGVPRK